MGHEAPAPAAGRRVALNPIQWFATADGWLDPAAGPAPEALLAEVKRAGFDAVHLGVPPGWSTRRYRAALAGAGLAPAPGFLAFRLPEEGAAEAATLDAARRAAGGHAELGVPHLFLSCGMARGAPRVRRPAAGADADAGRLARLIGLVGRIAEATAREGVRPALHPHVGTWIETEAETRAVLDAHGAATLGFGPDTGRLAWAGADLPGLLRDYGPRVAAVHVKDCRSAVLRRARSEGLSYQETVLAGLWAEPGGGDLDLDGLLAALPAAFDGWLIAEVDRPALPTPAASARACAAWLRRRTPGAAAPA
jgi:inosose dehydratase